MTTKFKEEIDNTIQKRKNKIDNFITSKERTNYVISNFDFIFSELMDIAIEHSQKTQNEHVGYNDYIKEQMENLMDYSRN